MSGKSIGFSFSGDYQVDGVAVKGEHSVSLQDGKVLWNGNLYSEIEFTPVNCESDFFTLFDVPLVLTSTGNERKINHLEARCVLSLKVIN